MNSIRRFGAAIVMAAVMAGGLGTAGLEAKGKGGSGNDAICEYLQAIYDYPYTSPSILAYVVALANKYGCTLQ